MPQHKGVEPFSRFWTVRYNVIVQSHAIAEGTFLSRPRVRVFLTASDAQNFYDAAKSQEQVAAGHPAPGTIQLPFLELYFNRKTFVQTFVQEHMDMLNTSS